MCGDGERGALQLTKGTGVAVVLGVFVVTVPFRLHDGRRSAHVVVIVRDGVRQREDALPSKGGDQHESQQVVSEVTFSLVMHQ